MFSSLEFIAIVVGIIGLTVSGWIVGVRVRRRMRKSLGRAPSDLELASLKTWMQVEQEEELNKAVKSMHPKRD